jgi:hypothetical protein
MGGGCDEPPQAPLNGQEKHVQQSTATKTGPAFLCDLDGTLVDSVYQHVLAWREALEQLGIELAVWRIHGRPGGAGCRDQGY